MQNTTSDMIIEAELEAFNLPDAEPTPQSVLLEALETDLYTREMLPQIPVSEAVRQVCQKEMREAERRGWSIR